MNGVQAKAALLNCESTNSLPRVRVNAVRRRVWAVHVKLVLVSDRFKMLANWIEPDFLVSYPATPLNCGQGKIDDLAEDWEVIKLSQKEIDFLQND